MTDKTYSLKLLPPQEFSKNQQKSFNKLITRLLKYHLIGSTLVEGSTFTENEAKKVLKGEGIHGHSIDEHLELTNGIDAASYMHRMFFQKEALTTELIDHCHHLLFKNIDEKKKKPGLHRGKSGDAAFTLLLDDGKTRKYEYEHPKILLTDYRPFIEYHINRLLPQDLYAISLRLAEAYFHFQMLHPYSDGNGRIGRFLISAKAAAERGLFFRFELIDGSSHLEIMMKATLQYQKNKRQVNLDDLREFIKTHLEVL